MKRYLFKYLLLVAGWIFLPDHAPAQDTVAVDSLVITTGAGDSLSRQDQRKADTLFEQMMADTIPDSILSAASILYDSLSPAARDSLLGAGHPIAEIQTDSVSGNQMRVEPDSQILGTETIEESLPAADIKRDLLQDRPGRQPISDIPVDNALQQSETALVIDTSVIDSSLVVSSDTVGKGDKSLTEKGLDGKGTKGEIKSLFNTITASKIIFTILFILFSALIIRMISRILNGISERSARLRLTFKRIIPVFRTLAWILVIFIVFKGILKPSTEAFLALGASIGVAVGFAAQDTLKNFFGGITILVEKPFQVGDKVEIDKVYGEVIHIGFRATRLVTPDDSTVSVPNADAVSKMVSNANSGETNCQVVAEFFLPPDIDMDEVRKLATEAAMVSGYIYMKKPINVLFFHEMGEERPHIKMRLKAYVMDLRYEFIFKSQMTEIVISELRKQYNLSGILTGNSNHIT